MILDHLWCPAGCSAKCERFVTGFFNMFGMSSWLFSKMWTFCRMIFGPYCDVLPPAQRNVNVFCHRIFWTHLWCPADFSAKCGYFVTGFLDPFVMSCCLLSEMWTFCHRIFLTRLWCPACFSAKCGCFVAWFLATFVMPEQLFSKMWTFFTGSMLKYWWCFQEEKKMKNHTRQSLWVTCGLLFVFAELWFIIKLIDGPLIPVVTCESE
jgi:hypothetical protein